jgi:hypothetical protein
MTKAKSVLADVYERLGQTSFKHYYSPLPMSSYHMTLMNLEVKRDSTPTNQWLINRRITYTNSFLFLLQLNLPLEGIEVEITDLEVTNRVAYLSVRVVNDAVSKLMNEFRDKTMSAFNINDQALKFHITLAYSYKAVDLAKMYVELDSLRTFVKQKRLVLDIPKLYFFEDMTRFVDLEQEVALN